MSTLRRLKKRRKKERNTEKYIDRNLMIEKKRNTERRIRIILPGPSSFTRRTMSWASLHHDLHCPEMKVVGFFSIN